MKKMIKFLKNTLAFILGIIQIIYLLPMIPVTMLRTWLLDNWEISKNKLKFMLKGAKFTVNNTLNGDNTIIYDYSYYMNVRTEEKVEFIRKAIL